MTPLPLFFAQIETFINQPVKRSVSTSVRDALIIVGCALVLAVILFAGVFVFRKRRSHHGHHYPTGPVNDEEPAPSRRRSRRRHRKPSHPEKRPRNPTLSETGGLPPLRQESDD